MDRFTRELESGDIHVRDKWQFELKSEFIPDFTSQDGTYTQEFYIFIPNALQINTNSYPKEDFFEDQTNFIRYKTPIFTLAELLDKENKSSPIFRIEALMKNIEDPDTVRSIEDELKLLGNIVRSAMRREVHYFVMLLDDPENRENLKEFSEQLAFTDHRIDQFFEAYSALKKELAAKRIPESLEKCLEHIEEFISQSINYYYTGLLDKMRKIGKRALSSSDKLICKRLSRYPQPIELLNKETRQAEFILYRSSLLNKYVLDPLLLNTSRSSPDKRLKNIIGSFAAGIAMLVYFVLFIWQGQVFLINSEPFILATVVLYILKDRLKEGLKTLSYKQAFRWFSDFTTKIYSSEEGAVVGKLKESFSFVEEKKLPNEIQKIRNTEFHDIMEDFRRPEKVIFYKRTIEMYKPAQEDCGRRFCLNIIFRYNILRFLAKADNPTHFYVAYDPLNGELVHSHLPKVYHLNIIMRNSFLDKNKKKKSEIKKFRLIIDKKGIKRLETVHAQNHLA